LTATTGPLLGLLGTVTGMIATFKLISSFGSGDPKMLAAGISEALMATATGMGVAIPALLLHAFLSAQGQEHSRQHGTNGRRLRQRRAAGRRIQSGFRRDARLNLLNSYE
jgi:biopolymer transport protein ExbB/TolQ